MLVLDAFNLRNPVSVQVSFDQRACPMDSSAFESQLKTTFHSTTLKPTSFVRSFQLQFKSKGHHNTCAAPCLGLGFIQQARPSRHPRCNGGGEREH